MGGRRRWWHVASGALLCLVLGACGYQNTSVPKVYNCPVGQTVWECTIKSTLCYMAQVLQACASDEASAIATANSIATSTFKPRDPIVGTTCTYTDRTQYIPPTFSTQEFPSCIVTTADDPCLTCAKQSCCGDYQACSADLNCSCLVGCLYDGGNVAACTSADHCGPASSVSISTAGCLSAACPGQCVSMGGMGTGTSMCQTGTGGGGTTGTTTGCTPGAFFTGDSCSSNGDCASCSCNAQTMTCN